MSYTTIPSGWRDVGKAVKKDLIDLVSTNLDDLNSRVTNVEGSISTAVVANQSIKAERNHAPIGSILWSPLDSTTFATATDDGQWQLCDGTNVAGSDYATAIGRSVVPDLRGKFMRMRAHGTSTTYNEDGDVATDTIQSYATGQHQHGMNHTHAHTIAASGTFGSTSHQHNFAHVHQVMYNVGLGNSIWGLTAQDNSVTTFTSSAGVGSAVPKVMIDGTSTLSPASTGTQHLLTGVSAQYFSGGPLSAPGGSGSGAVTGFPDSTSSVTNSGTVTSFAGFTAVQAGNNETRPHNVTEECYVKINKNYVTVRNGYLLWRAPQALTINQVVLTPVTQGTSGTLTVDVKKGPLTAITTSIFTSTPTMLYSATTAQTGTINATNAHVAAGEYVRVDITTTQAKLVEFHILIAATPG